MSASSSSRPKPCCPEFARTGYSHTEICPTFDANDPANREPVEHYYGDGCPEHPHLAEGRPIYPTDPIIVPRTGKEPSALVKVTREVWEELRNLGPLPPNPTMTDMTDGERRLSLIRLAAVAMQRAIDLDEYAAASAQVADDLPGKVQPAELAADPVKANHPSRTGGPARSLRNLGKAERQCPAGPACTGAAFPGHPAHPVAGV